MALIDYAIIVTVSVEDKLKESLGVVVGSSIVCCVRLPCH